MLRCSVVSWISFVSLVIRCVAVSDELIADVQDASSWLVDNRKPHDFGEGDHSRDLAPSSYSVTFRPDDEDPAPVNLALAGPGVDFAQTHK